MSSLPRVLIVTTSHAVFGATGNPTGLWLEELAGPYYVFVDAGCPVSLASIRGGLPPIDPLSRMEQWQTAATRRFEQDPAAKSALASSLPIDRVHPGDYDLLYLPGGFGTMWDFPTTPALTEVVGAFIRSGKIVATVCHAAAALVPLRAADGQPFVRGRALTSFTDAEEREVGAHETVPFLLESRLRELGARFEGGANWSTTVRTDCRLVTGQNPASAAATAGAALDVWHSQTSSVS
jgi:putative intracellular protease/amidase